MTKKFHEKSIQERRQFLLDSGALSAEDLLQLQDGGLDDERANAMIENVVGKISLPLGIAQNFIINGRAVLVPMAVEEPSIVAAASFMAKLAQTGGGFRAQMSAPEMIGQIQILELSDIPRAVKQIEAHKDELLARLANPDSQITRLGGGPRDLQCRIIAESAIGPFLVVHLIYDVRDVMGANTVNTAVENLAQPLEELTGGQVLLKILSNLADRRLARAEVAIPLQSLAFDIYSGETVARGIVNASAFAEADPYRAATHNKGIMNGMDAVALATGNDWRALEAGAHAYAARAGRYTSLSHWAIQEDHLHGSLELPMQVAIWGGSTRAHPTAQASLKLMKVKSANELGEIIASVGLAQNLGALRALATDGIQRGHMSLHARQLALAAGAPADQVDQISRQMIAENKISASRAAELVAIYAENKGKS